MVWWRCPRHRYKATCGEYADAVDTDDQVFESFGVKLLVDPKSLPYIDGTELDFVREGLKPMAKEPVPTMPILPEKNGLMKLVPVSVLAPLGIMFASHIRRYMASVSRKAGVSSVSCLPSAVSTSPPEAQTINIIHLIANNVNQISNLKNLVIGCQKKIEVDRNF